MKLVMTLMLLVSLNLFAYENGEDNIICNTNEQELITTEISSELESTCQDFLINFTAMDQSEIEETAKKCQQFYRGQLKNAIVQINKKEKTACDFLDLKDQVSLFNQMVERYIEFEGPDKAILDDMKDFYQVMYTSDNMKDCDDSALVEILLHQFRLENNQLGVIRL